MPNKYDNDRRFRVYVMDIGYLKHLTIPADECRPDEVIGK